LYLIPSLCAGSRWKVKALTYKISKYPERLAEQEVDREIEKALNVWAEVTDLTFEQRTFGKVHIDIKFEDRMHGDGDPFDGKGGTLAHAFFPVYGGDAHFDDSEAWTVNSVRGTSLLQTAAHEFGHSLGLSHSDQRMALMAPFYRGFESRIQLEDDDVRAIQALYGKGHTKNKKAPLSLTTSRRPLSSSRAGRGEEMKDLCSNTSIDSMLSQGESTYTLKGDQYWRLTEDSIAPGYPRSIAGSWDGLPARIDTSFTWTNGKSYFFKGNKYWRHSGTSMDKGYPKLIAKGFDGIPNNLDAAFVWSGNGKIYFFKGTQYWKFDPDERPPVKSSYPRPISNWAGVPDHVDDALQYTNGFTYFFKDGLYYRFDDMSFRVSDGDPAFPRPVGAWWFGCKASPLTRAGGHSPVIVALH
jgi:matrix metalloproteinase-14 (membrane-inserted)